MSGAHARHHLIRPWMILAGVMLMGLASLFLGPVPRAGAVTTPSDDACHTVGTGTPVGDCGPFRQIFRDSFNGRTVPVGAFSGCAGDGDFKCAGLKAKYPADYANWGAYPSDWYDTAGNPDEHRDRTFGGQYRPDKTISIGNTGPGTDGQLHVKMYGPTSAHPQLNYVAAVVPRKCMALRYGKFTERLVVRTRTNGFKMAHLRYTPNEVDYPEAGENFAYDPVSEYTHGFAESGADVAPNSAWTSWHTYSQEIVPGHIRFYFDGRLVKTVNADFPDAADWVLQNESALGGGYAAVGASVKIDTTWATCYRYQP
jgi:hypothetical protein